MSGQTRSAALSSGATYRLQAGSSDVTSGGGDTLPGRALSARFTKDARALLPSIPDKRVADAAKDLLIVIEEIAYSMAAGGIDMDALPSVQASESQDGSLSLEWATPDFRLGFNIEPNPEDSGWYLATSRQLGMATHGFLSSMTKQSLATIILEFVRANS